jgi:putative transposase
MMRKTKLVEGEIYHVFNRGVDKRIIFSDQKDSERFFLSMQVFNCVEPVGSLHEERFRKDKIKKPLVNFIAYNLLPNHFHFLLEQVAPNGISEFMKRLLGGYTWYYNKKHKRSGSLFQGTFKSSHINSNEYLLHASVYVNLNDRVPLGGLTAKWGKSSWEEYVVGKKTNESICTKKNIVLEQFRSKKEYKKFALSSLEDIRLNKEKCKELEGWALGDLVAK